MVFFMGVWVEVPAEECLVNGSNPDLVTGVWKAGTLTVTNPWPAMLKRPAFTLLICLICMGSARASHIMGSHIAYKWLGGQDYEMTLVLIRDCYGIALGTTELIEANSSCGTQTFAMPLVDTVEVASCSGMLSQCQGGTYPGAELHFYRDTVTIAACADWVLSWVSCCRNAAISNLVDPDLTGMTLSATLDNLNVPGNSTPIFQELPGVAICSNVPFCLPNGAYDADGDSVVYTQADPIGDSGLPLPFLPGFTATEPFSSANGHAFDPVTGNHCSTPDVLGQYVMAYKVDEYRNGTLIASSQREVQIWVINCPIGQMNINGTVNDTNGVAVSSGEVQLFQYGLNSFGSVLVNNATLGVGGSYSFPNQPVGQYLVRCVTDTVNYPGTANSYHNSTYYWTYADVVASQCDTNVVADIQLVPTGNLNGTGVLSGFLGDLGIVRSQVGAPWPGVGIMLEGWPSGGLMAFERTDDDGLWNMSGIPDGTYRVIVDHPGLPMRGHYVVTIGGGQNSYSDLDYTADPQGIWPSSTFTGVDPVSAITAVVVYPNPVDGSSVRIIGLPREQLRYDLIAADGKVARSYTLSGPNASLDLAGVPSGLYTLRSVRAPGPSARIVVR